MNPETNNKAEQPERSLIRNRVIQALALSASLTACDVPRNIEPPTTQDAGLQAKEVPKDAQADAAVPITDAGNEKEDENACKRPPLDPELQKMAESHQVSIGYHDEDGGVISKELTLDDITGKDTMLGGCEDGREEMLWSFIKHTRDKPQLQLEAIKRMTLSKSDLVMHIVTKEGMEEYKKKSITVMGPPPIQ